MGSRADKGGSLRLRALRTALLVALTFAGALWAGTAVGTASAADRFTEHASPINSGRVFDLGVSDHDADGNQELFSTNHKFLGTLTESDGSGTSAGWTDLMASADFGSTPGFPGFEDLLRAPVIDAPGLYVYALASGRSGDDPEKNPVLHVVANEVSGIPLLPEEAVGTITLRSPDVSVTRRDGADVSIQRVGNRTVIDFSVAEQGHIAIKVTKADVPPIEVKIDEAPLLAQTFIGADKVQAELPEFTLRLIDRHGVAWTDANRDGILDAFIVRGGLGGGIETFFGRIDDELLIADGLGAFSNQYEGSGLVKGKCRSRLTASVDYDADGLLDLFSSCKVATPKLYRALPGGEFGSRSKALKKVDSEGTFYRWIDLTGDRRPELVVFGKEKVVVLRSKGLRRWKVLQEIRPRNRGKLVYAAAVGDYDRDGDPDIFVGSNSRNTLLVNRRGSLAAVKPAKLGLPGTGSAASWVDFDNDGRLDLHSLPKGLYRQKGNGNFKRTGIARTKKNISWGLASWFDIDNDGYRDYAIGIRRPGGDADVDTRVGVNDRQGANWLQVDLAGSPGNPPGVGSRIRIRAGGERQTAWVGDADGARFSQGHYRVYFGLGSADSVDRVVVRWPDGGRAALRDVAANQRLVVPGAR